LPTDISVDAADPRESKQYYFEMTRTRKVVTPTVRSIFWMASIIKAKGLAYLPESGPAVIAANHLTNYDVIPIQLALLRPVFFMGKEELFRNPLFDWGLRQMGGFPVYRGEHDEWALDHAREVLAHRQVLGIFPEGKRSQGFGLHSGKTGAARLALAAGCPLIPLAVHGTQYMFHHFPRRTKILIAVGEPLIPQAGDHPLELTDRLMFRLADLLPPELRGVYARRPKGF
jgi:1-acyl-sn-glycerol-3-phosphate acyltransferase